jgi:hypothetical protein
MYSLLLISLGLLSLSPSVASDSCTPSPLYPSLYDGDCSSLDNGAVSLNEGAVMETCNCYSVDTSESFTLTGVRVTDAGLNKDEGTTPHSVLIELEGSATAPGTFRFSPDEERAGSADFVLRFRLEKPEDVDWDWPDTYEHSWSFVTYGFNVTLHRTLHKIGGLAFFDSDITNTLEVTRLATGETVLADTRSFDISTNPGETETPRPAQQYVLPLPAPTSFTVGAIWPVWRDDRALIVYAESCYSTANPNLNVADASLTDDTASLLADSIQLWLTVEVCYLDPLPGVTLPDDYTEGTFVMHRSKNQAKTFREAQGETDGAAVGTTEIAAIVAGVIVLLCCCVLVAGVALIATRRRRRTVAAPVRHVNIRDSRRVHGSSTRSMSRSASRSRVA